jgi:hypothetical protein
VKETPIIPITGRVRRLAVLACGAMLLAGCGAERNPLCPVQGTITVGGQPVPSGNVTFYPDTSKGNGTSHQPLGTLDAAGHFELAVPGGKKGAPPGWYKVVVYAVDDPQPGKPNRYFTSPHYSSVRTTPLAVEVIETPEPGRYDFSLKR